MISNFEKLSKYFALTVTLLLSQVGYLSAEESESLLNFKFNHASNVQRSNLFSQTFSATNLDALKYAQYDATWTYPWEIKTVNLDLGVTLRHLSGIKSSTENLSGDYFQQVFPLIHASALFELPLEGLSAGIEGSHIDSINTQVFDYKAKVSYEWRKGFGLQGGWQHQQFNLDSATDSGAAGYERTGPFVDFYLNF